MALSPQIVQAIARDGVKGDTLLGHLTRGDTVIPSQAPPAVHDIARQSMAAHGMDVNRFVAGAPGNHINPKTGLHSFEDGGSGNGGNGGEGGGSDSGGGGGGSGGGNGSEGGGGGSGPSGGGDKSGGDVGSGGGSQGGNPGDPGDTGGGGGTGTAGGNGVSGGANGMGVGGGNASGGANSGSGQGVSGADGAPSGAPGDDGFSASGVDTSARTGLTASEALFGVDLSDLGVAGKLAMGVVPGATTLAGLNAATAHGVDQANNPGGNLSAADTGGVGMGKGGATDPGAGGGNNGSEHPDTVQRVLNNQTVGGSNGGTAAPDAPTNKPNPVTPTDPFTDLKAALAAAHGIDKSPTFTSGSDAEILNAILGPQRAAAEQQLQNAHMRGTLSDQGYNSAELGLGTQDQQANSRIGNISDNLLAAYQQKLDAYANQAITSAGGTTQGNPWDVTPWQSGYNSLLSTLQGREQGDLLNLLPSGGSLYDIPTLLANAGNSQGLYNPGGSPIQQALSDQRGLGTTGVF